MDDNLWLLPHSNESSGPPAGEQHAPGQRTTDFNPLMLTAAREAVPLTQTELARLINVSQSLIAKWENGEPGSPTPSAEQMSKLAEALGVLPTLFSVSRSGRLDTMAEFYHRAFASAKRPSVNAAHARCCLVEIQIDRLLNLCPPDDDRIPNIDPDNHANDIEKIAGMARVQMGVPAGPVENLVDTIENCGGLVIDKGFEIDGVDALCRWVPGLPKLFYVNGNAPGDRIRTTLAHELGHTVMHLSRDIDLKLAEEQARRFAAAFLLPASEIRRDFGAKLDLEKLVPLKRKWRVSMQALAYRAHQLGCIDHTRYTSIFQQLSRKGWRKMEPVPVMRESPRARKRLIRAHLEAGYTFEELAGLLHTGVHQLHALLVDVESPDWQDSGVRMRIAR